MKLSVAHIVNELRHSKIMGFKEDSLWLWTMTSKLYISIDAIKEYLLFKLCVGVTTKYHTLVYRNDISVESNDNMSKNLYHCIQKDPNVFLAMKVGLRYRWYLKSEEEMAEENERGRRLDEIIDSVLR